MIFKCATNVVYSLCCFLQTQEVESKATHYYAEVMSISSFICEALSPSFSLYI